MQALTLPTALGPDVLCPTSQPCSLSKCTKTSLSHAEGQRSECNNNKKPVTNC